MGTRKHRQRQEPLWYRAELAEAPGHPFYQRLNRVLEEADFDRFLVGARGSTTRSWADRRCRRGCTSG